MSRFDAVRVLITGAGSGIGRATARRFAAEGARVACLDVKNADKTAAEIGAAARHAQCDVTDAAAVEQAVASLVERWGGVDVACNIAGIGHFRHSHEETPEGFDRIIRVNLHGTFHVCRAVLPHMLSAGKGVIINTASVAGLRGVPWNAAYSASKGGVIMLTRSLSCEYLERGIRVTALAPGGVTTNITESFSQFPDGADPKKMARVMTPLGMAEPEEMAAAYAYLASDEARYMTGTVLTIDGGVTA